MSMIRNMQPECYYIRHAKKIRNYVKENQLEWSYI